MRTLDVLREITTFGLQREANQAFLLGIAGDPDEADRARQAVLGPDPTPQQVGDAAQFLLVLYPPFTESDRYRLARCDLVVSVKGGPGITECRPADVVLISRPQDVISAVLDARPWLAVALARRLPGFRDAVADRLIHAVSRANAEFTVVAGIPTALPWLAPYVPAIAVADGLVLTKNQGFLLLRLAAVYGKHYTLSSRAKELLGVAGSGLGVRSLVRRAAGMLPGGVGLGVKATVAYTATYVLGRIAQYHFKHGREPDQEEVRSLRAEAADRARTVVREILARVRRRPPANGSEA